MPSHIRIASLNDLKVTVERALSDDEPPLLSPPSGARLVRTGILAGAAPPATGLERRRLEPIGVW